MKPVHVNKLTTQLHKIAKVHRMKWHLIIDIPDLGRRARRRGARRHPRRPWRRRCKHRPLRTPRERTSTFPFFLHQRIISYMWPLQLICPVVTEFQKKIKSPETAGMNSSTCGQCLLFDQILQEEALIVLSATNCSCLDFSAQLIGIGDRFIVLPLSYRNRTPIVQSRPRRCISPHGWILGFLTGKCSLLRAVYTYCCSFETRLYELLCCGVLQIYLDHCELILVRNRD